MPTVKEAFEWYRKAVHDGKGDLHTMHPVIIEEEAKKRGENPPDEQGRRKTKICWDAEDAETYALFHRERERYLQAANSHKGLATEAMICALRLHDDVEIRRFVEAIEEQKTEASGVPRAAIPAGSY